MSSWVVKVVLCLIKINYETGHSMDTKHRNTIWKRSPWDPDELSVNQINESQRGSLPRKNGSGINASRWLGWANGHEMFFSGMLNSCRNNEDISAELWHYGAKGFCCFTIVQVLEKYFPALSVSPRLYCFVKRDGNALKSPTSSIDPRQESINPPNVNI